MTEQELAKLLRIDEDRIKKVENKLQVFDAELKIINATFWLNEIDIEFWRCSFKESILFLPKENDIYKNAIVKAKILFYDCSFETFFLARGCCFEKDLRCMVCDFLGKVDFCETEFQGKVDFQSSVFKNEARFVSTKFQAKTLDKKNIENNFRETKFEERVGFDGAEFSGRVCFAIAIFKNEARFVSTKFQADDIYQESTENDFWEAQFWGDTIFDSLEFIGKTSFLMTKFLKNVFWNHVSFCQVSFRKTIFESSSVWQGVAFKKNVKFDSVYFGKEALFRSTLTRENRERFTTFQKVEFQNVVFREANFSKVEFIGDAIFNGVVFKDLINFHKNNFKKNINFLGSIFGGITSFYGTLFNNAPTFFKCTFGNQLNIEHKYLQYKYDEIEDKINNASENENQEERNPGLWRDLFRRLKSNRLVHHNVIDASELHTQELYARELEIKEKEKQEKISFKEKIEKWQLWFYRLTSDHHTDLAKIFNNVILLIALFALFASTLLMIPSNQESSTMRFIQENEGVLSIFDLKTLSPQTKKSFEIGWGMQWFLSSIYCVVFVLAYLGVIRLIEKIDKIENSKKISQGIYGVAYIVAFGFLTLKPALLLPIIGKFFDESVKINLLPMQSLCVMYYVVMILMLFSLQKTARKNSIIPS